jgi:hypothetical protein
MFILIIKHKTKIWTYITHITLKINKIEEETKQTIMGSYRRLVCLYRTVGRELRGIIAIGGSQTLKYRRLASSSSSSQKEGPSLTSHAHA